ncbi:hypothetical protein J6590_091461 [Homalodisca vitripennis]|nr:hypothetical protein J6590_091461 [Homalodisca vitripennis]
MVRQHFLFRNEESSKQSWSLLRRILGNAYPRILLIWTVNFCQLLERSMKLIKQGCHRCTPGSCYVIPPRIVTPYSGNIRGLDKPPLTM